MNNIKDLRGYPYVLSWNEYLKTGIQRDEYQTCKREGRYYATLDCKRWGAYNGLYLFFTTNEGQKIFAGVWGYKNNNIELHFLDRIPMGSKLLLTFKKGKRNKETAYLKEVRVVNSIWL